MVLAHEHWNVLEPLIGELLRRTGGRGRLWLGSRDVLNGILWILRTERNGPTQDRLGAVRAQAPSPRCPDG
jgi:hypothetical protein